MPPLGFLPLFTHLVSYPTYPPFACFFLVRAALPRGRLLFVGWHVNCERGERKRPRQLCILIQLHDMPSNQGETQSTIDKKQPRPSSNHKKQTPSPTIQPQTEERASAPIFGTRTRLDDVVHANDHLGGLRGGDEHLRLFVFGAWAWG